MKIIAKILLVVFILVSAPATADLYLHRYTGGGFDYSWGFPPDQDPWVPGEVLRIEFEMTLNVELPANLVNARIHPVDLKFNIGAASDPSRYAISSWLPYFNYASVSTNEFGEIISWNVFANRMNDPAMTLGEMRHFHFYKEMTGAVVERAIFCIVEPCEPWPYGILEGFNEGSWTTHVIPEYGAIVDPSEAYSALDPIQLNASNQDRPIHLRVAVYREPSTSPYQLATDITPPILKVFRAPSKDSSSFEEVSGGTFHGLGDERQFVLKGDHWHINYSLEGQPPGWYMFVMVPGSDDYRFRDGPEVLLGGIHRE